jgi:hypothetical protein
LLLAAPGGPAQAVGDGSFAMVDQVEESADFGEGERDESLSGRWCGFWCGGLLGSGVRVV